MCWEVVFRERAEDSLSLSNDPEKEEEQVGSPLLCVIILMSKCFNMLKMNESDKFPTKCLKNGSASQTAQKFHDCRDTIPDGSGPVPSVH